MNPAEQTVTWLITLGVLESPKKRVSDPEGFLRAALRDGLLLCRLMDRLRPGSVDKVFQDPRSDSESLSNIREFLKGCGSFRVEPFEVADLVQGQNFSRVLNSLVALNRASQDVCVGARPSSSLRIKSFDSLYPSSPHGRSSKLLHHQYRSLDMLENGTHQQHVLVKARFNFQPTNEDELSFSKGDVISVSRQEEGGWWEGTFNGKTGWFPSNYVREIKGSDKPVSPRSGTLKSPLKGLDTTATSKTYYNVVLQNILQTETEFSRELQTLLASYLRSLNTIDRLTSADIGLIQGNLEEICTFQQMLVQSLEESTQLPESQQRVGGFFLSLLPQMQSLYVAYSSNHPSAVSILTQHSVELGEFMEVKGAGCPGILTLTTGLSKPFMRLDRYPALLRELDRHMEPFHPDQPDIQKCMTAFKSLAAQCQKVRKRKELELQILTENVRRWEGEDIRTLGPVLYMSHTLVYSPASQESNERYLLLFPHVLLMLSTSPRMSGFIYQGRVPLAGLTVSRLEDEEQMKNAFEISGEQCECMQVVCSSQQDLQEWMEHLQRLTKHNLTVATPTLTLATPTLTLATPTATKPQAVPCHTMPCLPLTPPRPSETRGVSGTPAYHTLPHLSSSSSSSLHGAVAWTPLEPPSTPKSWTPLEPPCTSKPWSLSCLRPAPPLRSAFPPSNKEDLSKSPKSVKKLLPKRKSDRKPSEEDFSVRKSAAAALEEDAQILKVIEAYCTSAKTRQTLNSTWQGTDLMHNHVIDADAPLTWSDLSEDSEYDSVWNAHSHRTASVSRSRREGGVHMLFPEEEKIIVEEIKSNGQTVVEEKSLVDTVYGLKDEVQELKQDNKRMKRTLEEEQRARKELEKMVRRVLNNMDDPTWDETNL